LKKYDWTDQSDNIITDKNSEATEKRCQMRKKSVNREKDAVWKYKISVVAAEIICYNNEQYHEKVLPFGSGNGR